jgi:DNA-binding NarL/FixJ family response regulator
MTTSAVRVLLVEDHRLVREGLKLIFESDERFSIVAEATTLGEAVALPAQADLVVADLNLPDARGATTVATLRSRFEAPILVVTGHGAGGEIAEAFDAGAGGFLLKGSSRHQLVDAALAVARGQRYLDPSLGARMAERQRRVNRPLSHRETQVLRLLALGHTNNEIAKLLSVSPRTVEGHRTNVLRKLGLKTRADLVRYALDTGLIDADRR